MAASGDPGVDTGDHAVTAATPLIGRRLVVDLAAAFAIFLVLVWVATRFVATSWVVLGPSMEPTLSPGDRVVVDLWSYRHRAPRAGEVALFLGPGDATLIKRVVDPPSGSDPRVLPPAFEPERPGEASVYVLGDNPKESADSRVFGAVPAHRFRGKVIWRYWPLSRVGGIGGQATDSNR